MKKIIFIILILVSSNVFSQTSLIKKTTSVRSTGYETYSSTAYCLSGSRTATGAKVGRGIIAVDPRYIKLGSRVHILNMGYFIASDVGGAIKGRIIDIWMPCGQTRKHGRRNVSLRVL